MPLAPATHRKNEDAAQGPVLGRGCQDRTDVIDEKGEDVTFKSRGVRALVQLQMDEMNRLFLVWKKAKRVGVKLPATRDPAYGSLELLMRHPLRSCRGYLTWLCEVLNRPDPGIPDPPPPERVAAEGAAYLKVLAKAWERHMAWMPGKVLDSFSVYHSRWGAPMTVEAMFEHAVAHPMRHRFQLEELIRSKRTASAGSRRGRRL